LNPRHSVLSKDLSHELIFPNHSTVLYCESGGWSITPLDVQLHSLELNKGVVVASTGLPTVHHNKLRSLSSDHATDITIVTN